jgi:multimeric flavodoxin WrbA
LLAVEKAVEYAQRDPDVSVSVINIRDYKVDFCRGRDDKDAYGVDTRFILDAICDTDALIVGTPIYRGSYTGILKIF